MSPPSAAVDARRAEAARLRFDEGLTYREIGQRMGTNESLAHRDVKLSGRFEYREGRRGPDGTWRCAKCRQYLPLDDFGNLHKSSGQPHARCRACRTADARARGICPAREAVPREFWYSSFRTCRDGRYEWERKRDERLRRKYGITLQDFRVMLAEQRGRCPICQKLLLHTKKHAIHVDHSHRTGRVRGLLCHLCNVALGSIREDLAALMQAVRYLCETEYEWTPAEEAEAA